LEISRLRSMRGIEMEVEVHILGGRIYLYWRISS
jgi:hypothetical protein